ncbi:hypothetical protein MJM83_32285, partial [Salmonella enterica subsp. enterica serovar Montevideo]|nr:hypothetical protein [Salmonella enterica subsp. enterica serovar Montevideo]
EEVKDNLSLLDEVEQAARTVKGSERSWQRAGHEYTIWMDGEDNYNRARQILTDNMDILHAMKDALMKYETIDAPQIDDLMARRE